jgi:hypothetical protein
MHIQKHTNNNSSKRLENVDMEKNDSQQKASKVENQVLPNKNECVQMGEEKK